MSTSTAGFVPAARPSRAAVLLVPAAFAAFAAVLATPHGAGAQQFGPPAVLSDTVAASDSGNDYSAVTATDGAGNWVAVWESDDTLGGTVGTDRDIFVARSSDDGATWTAPAGLKTTSGTDTALDGGARVATSGGGIWIATWYSNDTLGGTIGTDNDILFARSTDNGATWSAPAAIASNAASDSGADVDAWLTTDGAGNWVVAWESTDTLGGTIGTDSDVLFVRSGDDGLTWSAPAALNSNAAGDASFDGSLDVKTDRDGNWVAIWSSFDSLGGTIGTDADILFARSTDNGATWSAAAPLQSNAATDSGLDSEPALEADGDGNWVATWRSADTLGGTIGTDDDILFARSTDNGATWGPVAPLNSNAATDTGSDLRPNITADGAGNWVASWFSSDTLGGTIGTDNDILFARSTDSGATWSAPAALNSNAAADSGADFQPRITTDRTGTWVAVWWSQDSLNGTIGTDYDILFERSLDVAVTWSAVAPLNTNAPLDTGTDLSPSVGSDGNGTWVAAWESLDTLGGTIGSDRDILFSRSDDDGATWSEPSALNTNAATDTGNDSRVRVASDGAGNWIAVWDSTDSLAGTIGTDIDLLFSRSVDGGLTWSAPAALASNAATDTGSDYSAAIASDGAGNWVVAWESSDSLGGAIGTDTDTLYARSGDDGATWSSVAAIASNAGTDSGSDFTPSVAVDGLGNWIVAWHSSDSLGGTLGTDGDILYVRSSNAGATWSAVAPLNSNAATDSGSDSSVSLATDADGNWVVVWTTGDSLGGTIGTEGDIAYSRSGDGGATWSAIAALNANASSDVGFDVGARIATDGAGHWLATWSSSDSLGGTIGNDQDILLARSSDGGATWDGPEALHSNAGSDAGTDSTPSTASDGAGVWITVWGSTDALGGAASFGVSDIFVASGTACGDGFVLGAEQCDGTECCSATCTFEADGTPCTNDGIGCTVDTCDGSGTCGSPDDSACDDGDPCTTDSCEAGTGCENAAVPRDPSSCLVAPATKFQVSVATDPAKSKLSWSWGKGDAFEQPALGDPLVDTAYTLCVFDTQASVAQLAASLQVAPSATLWSDGSPKGLKYGDKAGASDGVTKLQIKTGADAKTKVKLGAKGSSLTLVGPAGATWFHQDPSVVVQLHNSEGTCWTSAFIAADTTTHGATTFKAGTK